jgi:hypothetical protein
MTDKPKDAGLEQPKQQPVAKGTKKSSSDALDKDGNVNPEKLADNQRKLHVGSDHKTPDMKKGHRGTFP